METNFCRQYLEQLVQLQHLPAELMLSMSRPWRAQALPRGFSPGEQKQCFRNSTWLALENSNLTYVEGYACPGGLIPIPHAWCIDEEGNVVDVTLRKPETTHYFGIPVSREFLQNFLDTSGYYGLFGEMTAPSRYIEVLDDLQSGRWRIAAEAEAKIRTQLAPYIAA
jgi:hypothetical protein